MSKSIILLALALPFTLGAQVNTASLTGLIKDATGAVVSGAKVTATSKTTGVEHATKTDTSGYYFFPSLPVGDYTVAAEVTGFQRVTGSVLLETAQKGRQDFTLAVGAVQTTVAVEATAPQLSPQDASLGFVVDNTSISQYPLLLRSWDDLLSTVAGVQGNRYTDQGGGTSFGRTGGFNVHGVRSLQNNFILDGIDNNSISENVQELTTQVVRPSIDSIQEFKIITNPYSAEYGRSPGAAINVTTKGGTNQVHGVLYEYLRNRVLDANDFFSNRNALVKPQNVQNQFGGNIGAPIVKNKLFAFFDYEGTRIRRGVSRITTVPLPNERIGDFSAAAGARAGVSYPTIYDFTTGQPFANNQIPANRLDPVAVKLMAYFPQPTLPGKQVNNFARNAGQLDDNGRYDGRVDFQPRSQDSVFGRYSFTTRQRFIPGNFGGIADGTSSSSQGRQHLTAHQVATGWTRVLGPKLVNELRIGFARNNSFAAQDPFGLNKVSDIIPGVPANPAFDGGLSRTTFSSFNTFLGSPDFLPKFQVTQQYQFSNTLSYTRGTHQFKFGADLRLPLRNNFLDVPGTRGSLNFDRFFTCQRNAAGQCVANTGLSYADFLTGYVQSAQLTNLFVVDQRLHMYSFFAQDDYKVSPKLTLNLGLRYDFGAPAVDGRNRMANFNPAGAGSLVFAKSGSLEERALVKPDRNNFAPRVGLGYQINPATVLRAGYGIFYGQFDRIGSEDQLALNPPGLINNVASVPQTATAPVFQLRNGFPADYLDPAKLDLTRVRIRAANPSAPSTYVQQWSFGLQRTLPLHLFVEANYVGTKSTRLNTLRNLNQQIGGALPYRNFGYIEYRDPLGNAVYHGLELTVEHRFWAGLTLRSAYTYSKSLDNTAEHLGASGSPSFNQNGRDFKSWRGPSDFDYRQRWVTSYVYELPFGKGKAMASSGVLSYIVGGFRTSGGLTLATGRPFTVRASANNATIDPAGAHNALPNVIGAPAMLENVDCWFYNSRSSLCKSIAPGATDAFVTPPPGVFGNSGRNTLRGPGTAIFDFAVHRDFKFAETKALQFRWEVFNLTNTTQFGLPDSSISNTSVGSITSLAGDARIMQFALRLSF